MRRQRRFVPPMVALLLVVLSLPGCALMEAHYGAIDAARSLPPATATPQPRERWHESYVIEKDGNCQLIDGKRVGKSLFKRQQNS
jgi:hypothetical protein